MVKASSSSRKNKKASHYEASAATTAASMSLSTSILVLVLDLSPLAWGERDILRSAQDRARLAANKRSNGPATLEELLTSIQAFVAAYTSMERNAALLILGVADSETALLYPRKDALHKWLGEDQNMSESYSPSAQEIPSQLLEGVSTLLTRAAKKAASRLQKQQSESKSEEDGTTKDTASSTAADSTSRQGTIASAVSSALCLLNRIMVATQATGGVSALHSTHYLNRTEDEGVVAMMGSNNNKKKKKDKHHGSDKNKSAWSPRILIVQASEDRSRDYNAMMNCAFCASQQKVVIDGCFLTAGSRTLQASSPFLEQVCDLTGGVYMAPPSPAQVGGALTEVLVSVFLSRVECRSALHLPASNNVDFRARCFETAQMVDLAFVCNQCLSIFSQDPSSSSSFARSGQNNNDGPPLCPTCQARILKT